MVAIVRVNVSAILVFGFALQFTQTMLPDYKIVGCLWRNVGLGLALRHPTYCELVHRSASHEAVVSIRASPVPICVSHLIHTHVSSDTSSACTRILALPC